MGQRILKYYDDEVVQFEGEAFKRLKQYMSESSDIAYLISTRDKLIAKSGVAAANKTLVPNLFPLSGEPNDKPSDIETRVAFALLQYCADYMNSRGLLDADSTILAQEAERLAKLLLTSVTEIATVILMAGMAELKLLKQTPNEQRPELIRNMYRDRVWMQGRNLTFDVIYETRRKKTCCLTLEVVDEDDNSKLLSELHKPIVCRYATSVKYHDVVPGDSIPWTYLPTFIKDDILVKEED